MASKNIKRQEFINLINEKYNGLYECQINKDKEYVKPSDNIYVVCQKHGLFVSTAYSLLNGEGCFDCFIENRWKGNEEDKTNKKDD